jgi:hypothetical protein
LAHAIGAGQIGLHSALRESLDGFFPSVRGQLQRTAKSHETGLCSLAAVVGTSPDQFALGASIREPCSGATYERPGHRPSQRPRCNPARDPSNSSIVVGIAGSIRQIEPQQCLTVVTAADGLPVD